MRLFEFKATAIIHDDGTASEKHIEEFIKFETGAGCTMSEDNPFNMEDLEIEDGTFEMEEL